MATQSRGLTARIGALTMALVLASCGGRTQLIPAYQIGRLSSDAVVAHDGGVRVVIGTAAWPGPPLDFMPVIPIEMTLDNGSTYRVQVNRQYVALVTEAGTRVAPSDPSELPAQESTLESLKARALPERVLAPDERITGFVYFVQPREAEQLELVIDLVDAATDKQFGRIEIPFAFE